MATLTKTVKISAGGTGTITVKPDGRETWIIRQVSIELSGTLVGSTCDLRKNDYLVTPFGSPAADTAFGDPPVLLLPSDAMTINWAGGTSGTIGKALINYDRQ